MSNFDSFSYFQTSLSNKVEQGFKNYQNFTLMTLDFYFTATSSFLTNVRLKPYSKHSGGGGGQKEVGEEKFAPPGGRSKLTREMGFTWTFPRNLDATVKLKSELISIKF